MHRLLAPLAVAGFMLAGSFALADDEVSNAGIAQQHRAMKDCMAKHASSDERMTKDDIERACKQEMKSRKDNSGAMSSTPGK